MVDSAPRIDSVMRPGAYTSPQTPSTRPSSSSITAEPHFSMPWQNERSNRKRSRNESWEPATPHSTTTSPAPFANMKYRLSGAQESPIHHTSQNDPYNSMTPDTAFRRGRPYALGVPADYFHDHCGDSLAGMPGKADNENGVKHVLLPAQSTWSSLVFGLAGKVFELCTAGTFRGFFAGGGQGYRLEQSTSATKQTARPGQELGESSWTDIPTSSTAAELEDEYSQATKKSKILHDSTWVVVQPPSRPDSPVPKTRSSSSLLPRVSSPTKTTSPAKVSFASTATIGHPQSAKRPTSNLHRTLSTQTASSAGLRSSKPVTKPHQQTGSIHSPDKSTRNTTLEQPHQRRKSHTTPSTSPVRSTNHKSTPSTSTPTSHEGGVQTYEQAESPLAKETRRHLDKVRKQELAEDREIIKMNNQLKDLIKQGQEALDTRIEVEFVGESDDW
ncbi:MAG: hypothetical protein GOMPHAMPRED_000796 [Gomphillus americanus]|uniref:Uncharacterized protein n=1 Tax=Gomphillus americanus TaxID=1940652 RepID=A0A8H3EZX6_9LECA|nr:MAG: hypothetical protein GOMPHAMPRED_000796 [Gomphillus americanus]